MTATVRVSAFKKERRGLPKKIHSAPRQGTMLRAAYDALRRGEIVKLKSTGVSVNQLRDFYGMDLESVKSDNGRLIGSRLIGEWDGPYYVPIERIVSEETESV